MEYSEPFEIFTSLRYDTALSSYGDGSVSPDDSDEGEFYMLRYHFDRLAESIQNFKFDNVAPQLENYESLVCYLREEVLAHRREHNNAEGPYKVGWKAFSTTKNYREVFKYGLTERR